MLIRITNKCRMGCSHCMIESSPDGEEMTFEKFKQALEFSIRVDPSLIFISGGEPTDHPMFLEFATLASKYAEKTFTGKIIVGSNGMFLDNEEYTSKILNLGLNFQITNDPRFYPHRIKKIDHPALIYEDHIRQISPFGRAVKNGIASQRQAPMCFNLRSVCNNYNDVKMGIKHLRMILKMCTPSINIDGSVVAGETSSCYKIGSVESSDTELLENIRNMKCGICGLYKNLTGVAADLWSTMESFKKVSNV